MTQEEIKELIKQEIKEKLQVRIETGRIDFSPDTRVEVYVIYEHETISWDSFIIENKEY